MNYQMTKYILGIVLLIASLGMLFPFIMSCFEGDWQVIQAFLTCMLLTAVSGIFLARKKPQRKSIYARDGFLIVGLTWIIISLFGSLPYFFSQSIPAYIDALFESVSGFTTTGSSILVDIEALPRSVLLWRSITHWIGGMGVLVFITAIVSFAGGNSMYLMRAEAAAPSTGKMAPKIKKNTTIIYSIYFGLTALAFVLLMFGGIGWFDSLTTAFSLVATGGFHVRNASIGFYNSAYVEWISVFFMIVSSINFHLLYLLLIRKFSTVFKNEEFRAFSLILLAGFLISVFSLRFSSTAEISEIIRASAFQVASFMSTSGFISADYGQWPQILMIMLLVIAFVGGCSGSTAGGAKVMRMLYLTKSVKKEVRKMLHPNAVEIVKIDGKPVEDENINGVFVFFSVYFCMIVLSLLLIAINGFDLQTTVSSVLISASNTGIGFGDIGPGGSFAAFSPLSKLVFIFDMLCGRLSIFPILFVFIPSMWAKRKNSKRLEI